MFLWSLWCDQVVYHFLLWVRNYHYFVFTKFFWCSQFFDHWFFCGTYTRLCFCVVIVKSVIYINSFISFWSCEISTWYFHYLRVIQFFILLNSFYELCLIEFNFVYRLWNFLSCLYFYQFGVLIFYQYYFYYFHFRLH